MGNFHSWNGASVITDALQVIQRYLSYNDLSSFAAFFDVYVSASLFRTIINPESSNYFQAAIEPIDFQKGKTQQ